MQSTYYCSIEKTREMKLFVALSVLLWLASLLTLAEGFVVRTTCHAASKQRHSTLSAKGNKFTNERRKKLGINEDDDEYDLDVALNNNTDPLISKIIAGSLIVTLMALLVVGVIIPYTTDYGEGVCNALLTQGRC
jgi:hypothetical protein